MPILRDKQAMAEVRKLGLTLTKRDGEYRLSDKLATFAAIFPEESRNALLERIELRAYYTNDAADALHVARYYWQAPVLNQ